MGIYADQQARLYSDMSTKAAPVVADSIPVWDSEDSSRPKRIALSDLPAQAGADSTAVHVGVAAEISAVALKAAPVAADEILLEDSAASYAKKSATIGSIPIAQAQVVGVPVSVAQDAAAAITGTTCALYLVDSTSGTKVIDDADGGIYAGQVVPIRLALASGGEYNIPVTGGTLTFNATSESAVIVRNAANDGWLVMDLNGATIV